ncbi:polysaccharide deacetylase family protein [Gaetbulibacter sp. M240]|uniref:polysaccharide deacetylase family protein n=1 Tax=Gaetbulibacter sp. M240 TaxID=3126511 RepID=UPI00374EA326
MSFAPVKTPAVAKKMFPNYIWDMPATEKVLYLTFDDGPTPDITSWTLNILAEYNAKATFFCIGKNIQNHPDLFKEVVSSGHSIGNHTQNHIKGWKTKAESYLENVGKAQDHIEKHLEALPAKSIASESGKLFRPPYGQISPKQGKKLITLGYHVIMWDVIAFDWDKSISPETCLKHVTSKAKEGSIVVFHDSVKAQKNMQYALPKTLDYFSEKGYRFAPIQIKK